MPIPVRPERRPARVARHAPAFRSIAVPVRPLPDGWKGQPHRIAARPNVPHSALAPVVNPAAGVAQSNPPRLDPNTRVATRSPIGETAVKNAFTTAASTGREIIL